MNAPGNERQIASAANWVTADQLDRLKAKRWPAGTVIFPKVGAALRTEKRRLLCRPSAFDNNVMGAVPGPQVSARYLFYALQTVSLGALAQAGPVPSVNQSLVGNVELWLPARHEQERIVEVLDAVADAVAARERQRACCVRALDNLRQHLLADVDAQSVKLEDVCLPVATHDPRREPDEVIAYVDIGAVDRTSHRITYKMLRGGDAPSRARQLVHPGDVLVSTVQPNLRGVARVPTDSPAGTPIASTGFCVLRAGDKVSNSYLMHCVLDRRFTAQLVKSMRGATFKAVRPKEVLTQEIALPTRSEQDRIAGILDAATADLRTGTIAAVDESISGLRHLHQQLLAELVTGQHRRPSR